MYFNYIRLYIKTSLFLPLLHCAHLLMHVPIERRHEFGERDSCVLRFATDAAGKTDSI